jgi:hypothetical protein
MKKKRNSSMVGRVMLPALVLGSACAGALAAETEDGQAGVLENNVKVSGYARTWASFNLQNPPETPANDRGDLSMLRGSILVDVDAKTGPLQWKAIGRIDREYRTSYMQRLESQVRQNTPGGPGSHMLDAYNHGELRELYVDAAVGERIKLRLGKQQVVWGETDFFRAMDVVNGFDYRWRSFLERENEELRKPLILANAKIDVPEANGNLQVLFRPGLDRDRDIGNTYDLSGGRWSLQPNKGVDFLAPGLLSYNYHSKGADVDDKTGGVRWSGVAGPLNYSLAWLKTFSNDPVVNSSFAPSGQQPAGTLGDFVFPKIDLIGVTLSGYSAALDAVLSTELVYTKHAPYNAGSNFASGALPGFGGIVRKNLVTSMVRVDKSLNLARFLGTSRPSFFSVQVFDKWIKNFSHADDLVELAGFGAPVREHTTIVTGILGLNYNNDKVNPQLAVGTDASNGGGFMIPSVELVWGSNWRFVAEADFFFKRHQKLPGMVEQGTHLFGQFANNNQLVLRLTRQF